MAEVVSLIQRERQKLWFCEQRLAGCRVCNEKGAGPATGALLRQRFWLVLEVPDQVR
jgi:hypothetical protein